MEEITHDPVKGLADEELKSKLKLRHRMSEGNSDAHCFIHDGSLRDAGSESALCDEELRQREEQRDEEHSGLEEGEPVLCKEEAGHDCAREAPTIDCSTPPVDADELAAAAAEDEADKLQYEWQFDILSSFPRDKAIALVEHLRRSERERAQASATALRLQRTNSTLEKQLDAALTLLQEKGPPSPRLAELLSAASHEQEKRGRCSPDLAVCSFWRSRWPWYCCAVFLGLVVVLLRRTALVLEVPPLDGGSAPVLAALSGNASSALPTLGEITGQLDFQQQAKLQSSGVHCRCAAEDVGDGLVRETTVREMTLRETTTREYDPEAVAKMSQEHEAMREQLERLWLDIDVAVQRNQDMVCWKL